MQTEPIEAVIFDLDGTLIDTERPDWEACRILCAELGITLSLEYWAKTIVGRMGGYDIMYDEIIRPNANSLTRSEFRQRHRDIWRHTLQNVSLMPGVSILLDRLHAAEYPLAVATASDGSWADRWLNHFEIISYFQAIACSDHVVHNKPAPDVYLFAAARLGIAPERCLVFEDSVAGVQAAKAAGMTVVAVPSHETRSLEFDQAHSVIEGLDQVSVDWISNGRDDLLLR